MRYQRWRFADYPPAVRCSFDVNLCQSVWKYSGQMKSERYAIFLPCHVKATFFIWFLFPVLDAVVTTLLSALIISLSITCSLLCWLLCLPVVYFPAVCHYLAPPWGVHWLSLPGPSVRSPLVVITWPLRSESIGGWRMDGPGHCLGSVLVCSFLMLRHYNWLSDRMEIHCLITWRRRWQGVQARCTWKWPLK